jgi:hypothetical protein
LAKQKWRQRRPNQHHWNPSESPQINRNAQRDGPPVYQHKPPQVDHQIRSDPGTKHTILNHTVDSIQRLFSARESPPLPQESRQMR